MKIIVIGLWHQGIVAAACFAKWGHTVVAVDSNLKTIESLKKGMSPIYEPGLNNILLEGIEKKKLTFDTELIKHLDGCKYILFAHDTPVNEEDESDLTIIYDDLQKISRYLSQNAVLHITAQIPVGTCDKFLKFLNKVNPKGEHQIAYTPENLRLGEAINRFENPALPIIGTNNKKVIETIQKIYSKQNIKWKVCDLTTAEMLKHALNSYLATSITFANELGNICDEVGANAWFVAECLRLEPRVGSKAMLFPGLAFSGGTLARDLKSLIKIGIENNIDTNFFQTVLNLNIKRNDIILRKLKNVYKNGLSGKKICVLGLTYKPNTSTLRRSASLELIRELQDEGVKVTAYDPVIKNSHDLKNNFGYVENDIQNAIKDCDAIVLMTPWDEFRNLNLRELKGVMLGKVIFDTANIWNKEVLKDEGFELIKIGYGNKGLV